MLFSAFHGLEDKTRAAESPVCHDLPAGSAGRLCDDRTAVGSGKCFPPQERQGQGTKAVEL
jgi:hypothetical protein